MNSQCHNQNKHLNRLFGVYTFTENLNTCVKWKPVTITLTMKKIIFSDTCALEYKGKLPGDYFLFLYSARGPKGRGYRHWHFRYLLEFYLVYSHLGTLFKKVLLGKDDSS